MGSWGRGVKYMSLEATHHHPVMDDSAENEQLVAFPLDIECTCCHLAVLASRPELSAWRLVLIQQACLQLANVSIFLLLGCLILFGFGHLHAVSLNACIALRRKMPTNGLLLHWADHWNNSQFNQSIDAQGMAPALYT